MSLFNKTGANSYSYSTRELGITTSDVTKYITKDSSDLPDLFITSLNKILTNIDNLCLNIGFQIHKANLKEQKLFVANEIFSIGNDVEIILHDVEKVAVFACTAGKQFDELSNQYTSPEDSYLIDILGTVLVEKLTNNVISLLQNEAKENNLSCTNTISPGNCGWQLDEQEKLFKLLPHNFLNITLNKYGMMHPVKSISGIVGIGKKVSFNHSDCDTCTSKNCLYRKSSTHTN